jgi:hypothetical protein
MDNNNPWKYVQAGDVSNNPYFKKTENIENATPESIVPDSNTQKESPIDGVYSFIEDKPYAKTVHKLQNSLKANPNAIHPTFTKSDGSKIYRQLTFKENIEARINDYETKLAPDGITLRSDDERTKLFKKYLDSCTGFAYKSGSKMFKINPVCEDLIIIDKSFNEEFKPIAYSSFQGKEFNSANGIYGSLLTKTQFLDHEAYRYLYDNDKNLMNAYWDIVHTLKPQDSLIGLWVRQNTTTDELRALFVYDIDYNSYAYGNNYLSNNARFLLVAPSKKNLGKK